MILDSNQYDAYYTLKEQPMHRFTATFDDDVFEAMRIAAKRDHRSITSLVISTMEKAFGRVSIDDVMQEKGKAKNS